MCTNVTGRRRWQPVRPCDGSRFSASPRPPAPPRPPTRRRLKSSPPVRASLRSRTPPQNTQFFEWPATSGADAYRVRFDYYENNTLKASPVVNCANANSGSNWANWSGVATLQHGGQYGVCAQGHYSFPNDSLFFPDGPNSCSMGTMLGRRAYTTIDRSKPTAALHARGRRGVREGHEGPAADRLRRRRRRTVPRELPLLRGRRRAGQPVRQERRARSTGTTRPCSVPGSAGKVDHVHLHRRLRRDPGRERVGVRDRGRRLDPGQPERAQPERARPTRPTCPTRAATAWCSTARRRRSRSAWPRPR